MRDRGGTASVDFRPGAGMTLELSVPKEPKKEVLP